MNTTLSLIPDVGVSATSAWWSVTCCSVQNLARQEISIGTEKHQG